MALTTAFIYNNDEVITFMRDNNYPVNYNDGLLAYFRAYYSITGSTLPDLFMRYTKDVGLYLVIPVTTFFLLAEDGNFLVKDDDSGKLILEGV